MNDEKREIAINFYKAMFAKELNGLFMYNGYYINLIQELEH